MYSRQHVSFAPDRTYVFKSSSVGTDSFIEYLRADFFFGEIVNTVLYFSYIVGIDFFEVFDDFFFRKRSKAFRQVYHR